MKLIKSRIYHKEVDITSINIKTIYCEYCLSEKINVILIKTGYCYICNERTSNLNKEEVREIKINGLIGS